MKLDFGDGAGGGQGIKSTLYLVINTHKGLYKYKRLPFWSELCSVPTCNIYHFSRASGIGMPH